MSEWVGGWVDGWMGGWVDRWALRHVFYLRQGCWWYWWLARGGGGYGGGGGSVGGVFSIFMHSRSGMTMAIIPSHPHHAETEHVAF